MNCGIPLKIANWNQWKDAFPLSPLDILSYCAIKSGSNTDIGSFTNSVDYNIPQVLPTLKIVGIQVLATQPSAPPKVLAVMTNPIGTLTIFSGDAPDLIDIYFNHPPDILTVTNASCVVTAPGIPPVPSRTTAMTGAKSARITFSIPLGANTYSVNLHGSTGPTIKEGTDKLDGDPVGLPSGDNSPGTDFTFTVSVVGVPQPVPPEQPDYGSWVPDPFMLVSAPTCSALGTDNLNLVGNANQWNFLHRTSVPSTALAPQLNDVVFLRGGNSWLMTIPINLGSLEYPNIQVSFRNDAGTRGDCSGTFPAILFAARNYTGVVELKAVLGRLGKYIMGIRAVDEFGNSYMYEMTWNIVA